MLLINYLCREFGRPFLCENWSVRRTSFLKLVLNFEGPGISVYNDVYSESWFCKHFRVLRRFWIYISVPSLSLQHSVMLVVWGLLGLWSEDVTWACSLSVILQTHAYELTPCVCLHVYTMEMTIARISPTYPTAWDTGEWLKTVLWRGFWVLWMSVPGISHFLDRY